MTPATAIAEDAMAPYPVAGSVQQSFRREQHVPGPGDRSSEDLADSV